MRQILGRGAEHGAQTRGRIGLSDYHDIRADPSCLPDDLTSGVSHGGRLIGLVEVVGKLTCEPFKARLHLAQSCPLCGRVRCTLSHVHEPQPVPRKARRAQIGRDIGVCCLESGGVENRHPLLSGGPGLEDFAQQNPQMHKMIADLFQQVKEADMISCVCQACSNMMGSLEDAKGLALPLCSELKGHPSMTRYIEEGYEIISF